MIISTSDIRVKAKANTHNITAGRVYHLIAAFMENSAGRVTMGTTVLPAHGDHIIERIYKNERRMKALVSARRIAKTIVKLYKEENEE